jgi:hypothetical protein
MLTIFFKLIMGVELHVLDPSFYEHTEKKKPKVSLIGT